MLGLLLLGVVIDSIESTGLPPLPPPVPLKPLVLLVALVADAVELVENMLVTERVLEGPGPGSEPNPDEDL